ncbi:MAG: hypothetical protein AAF356_08380 [Planctomycetota bacterium]
MTRDEYNRDLDALNTFCNSRGVPSGTPEYAGMSARLDRRHAALDKLRRDNVDGVQRCEPLTDYTFQEWLGDEAAGTRGDGQLF